MDFVDKASIELAEDADGMNDIEFHSNVRENIVSLFTVLCILWNAMNSHSARLVPLDMYAVK